MKTAVLKDNRTAVFKDMLVLMKYIKKQTTCRDKFLPTLIIYHLPVRLIITFHFHNSKD